MQGVRSNPLVGYGLVVALLGLVVLGAALFAGGRDDIRTAVEQQALGVFQRFLDADEEGDRFLAVDDAVVVADGHVHHRPGNDLAVFDHGAFLDRVHAENGRLRHIDDRRAHHGAKDAAVRDGERAAAHVCDA